jgi:hypothetical protein
MSAPFSELHEQRIEKQEDPRCRQIRNSSRNRKKERPLPQKERKAMPRNELVREPDRKTMVGV